MNNLSCVRLSSLRALAGGRTRNGDKIAKSILLELQLSRENIQVRLASSKLDEIVPVTVDFPARHIGPRKHDARYLVIMLSRQYQSNSLICLIEISSKLVLMKS